MNIKRIILLVGSFLQLGFYSSSAQNLDTTAVSYRRPLFDFDPLKSSFKLDQEQKINKHYFLRMSILTGYREGVEPIKGLGNFRTNEDKENGTKRFYMYNLSIQDMLTHGFYTSNRIILEVKDPSRYRYDPSQGSEYEWMRKNAHCFEFILPSGVINGVKPLEKELCRIFGVESGLKKRMVNALVLVRTSKIDKIRSSQIGERGYDNNGQFRNVPIDRLSSLLYNAGLPPMVDETGYKDPVDLELKITSWKDLPAIRKELQRYDLDLKEEKREVEMFVITEIDR
ncbi:hypothetical protein [Pedobacter cryoconitis]|uniref:Uncharacterized protein n=1 Tax=Pedobacter cryoconitis TaxID=188932 RepID=A0A7X0J6B3_9SPHI|nr:hypothetical protein [Pedobacter cryoconitis]MBB6501660.1 hypothetical protein [Pedobacter cryoconitis]